MSKRGCRIGSVKRYYCCTAVPFFRFFFFVLCVGLIFFWFHVEMCLQTFWSRVIPSLLLPSRGRGVTPAPPRSHSKWGCCQIRVGRLRGLATGKNTDPRPLSTELAVPCWVCGMSSFPSVLTFLPTRQACERVRLHLRCHGRRWSDGHAGQSACLCSVYYRVLCACNVLRWTFRPKRKNLSTM